MATRHGTSNAANRRSRDLPDDLYSSLLAAGREARLRGQHEDAADGSRRVENAGTPRMRALGRGSSFSQARGTASAGKPAIAEALRYSGGAVTAEALTRSLPAETRLLFVDAVEHCEIFRNLTRWPTGFC